MSMFVKNVWIAKCSNPWCSGSEHFATYDDRPDPVPHCPTCGYYADIEEIDDDVNDK